LFPALWSALLSCKVSLELYSRFLKLTHNYDSTVTEHEKVKVDANNNY